MAFLSQFGQFLHPQPIIKSRDRTCQTFTIMKMSLSISAILMTAFLKTFGQITVTNAAFPVAGDSVFYSIDTLASILPGASGGNQNWDFTTLVAAFDRQSVYQAAANGQNAASFPNAELVVISQANETYYNTTATRFENVGYTGAGPFNLPLNLKFSPPVAERRAPLTFGGFPNQESTNLSVTFPTSALAGQIPNLPATIDSLRVKIEFKRLDFADAWGTLKLPAFTHNVLREKRFQTTDTKIEILVPVFGWIEAPFAIPGAGLDTTITYNYFSETDKEAVAVVTMNAAETEATSVRYKRGKTLSAIDNLGENARATVQAYPNPAVEHTVFYCSNVPEGQYVLKLYNVIGTVVWRQEQQISGSKSVRLDLENFKKGTYLYSLSDMKGNILATKRLMIVKP